jgi:hypothetical protein
MSFLARYDLYTIQEQRVYLEAPIYLALNT